MGLLIRILSPGKIREAYLREAVEQARLALQRQLQASGGRVELVEVEDSPDNWPVERALALEAERLRGKLKSGDFVVALDLDGRWPKLNSQGSLQPELARWQAQAQQETIVFLIGGSNGLAPDLKQQAQVRLCLSRLTFTHQMARLILLDLLGKAR